VKAAVAVAVALLILLSACATPLPQATLSPDHPLNGRIWQPATQSFIAPDAMQQILLDADYVLLGEKHDNSMHHRLQADVVENLVMSGLRPAIAFEMINTSQGNKLQIFLADKHTSANGLGEDIGWQKSGWPDWRYYAPIATIGLKAGLAIHPANCPRTKTREIGRKGFAVLDAELVERTGLNEPLPAALANSLTEEMYLSHCKMMPRKHLGAIANIQRARDAVMADTLAAEDKAVLIAGAGHTRRDRGVPYYLRRLRPTAKIVAVGYIEVDDNALQPTDYAAIYNAERLPFDLVWFTPRLDTVDPCEKFKSQLKKMKKKKIE